MTVYAAEADIYASGVSASALAGTASAGDISTALAAASSLVDSYLAKRFDLPLTVWGLDLTRATAVLAGYDLLEKRGFDPNAAQAVAWKEKLERTTKWLEGIAKGLVTPAFPLAKDNVATDPTSLPFVSQPASGSIGSSGSSFAASSSDAAVTLGTPITPRLRGW